MENGARLKANLKWAIEILVADYSGDREAAMKLTRACQNDPEYDPYLWAQATRLIIDVAFGVAELESTCDHANHPAARISRLHTLIGWRRQIAEAELNACDDALCVDNERITTVFDGSELS